MFFNVFYLQINVFNIYGPNVRRTVFLRYYLGVLAIPMMLCILFARDISRKPKGSDSTLSTG